MIPIQISTTITLLCALAWASPAFAADDEKTPEGSVEKVAKSRGKFSLLGTECKADGDGALDTTPGSPPLDVDDPGTPGCNGWEINIVASGEFGNNANGDTPLLDINYGIGDNIQLKYEIPYQLSRVDGASRAGVGRAELGIKYRFYDDESRDLSVAVYPQVEFAMPGTAANEDGDADALRIKLPLLFSTKVGETSKGDIMITANVGYNTSTAAESHDYISAAFGVGLPLMKNVALMLEASTEQAISKNVENVREGYFKVNLGLLGPINEHLMWLAAAGQSFASSEVDDPTQTCLLLGVRVLVGGP
jgi:hypothetical protein